MAAFQLLEPRTAAPGRMQQFADLPESANTSGQSGRSSASRGADSTVQQPHPAGALTVHVDAATQRFGLATTLAGCPTVGIAGLTLGGGEGLLMVLLRAVSRIR
jgi:hypothetical protein